MLLPMHFFIVQMQTFIFQNQLLGSAVAMIVWELDLQLPVQCPLQV